MNSREGILVIDVGSSKCKASYYLAEGTLSTATSARYDTVVFRENWVEQDPCEIWNAVQQSVHHLTDKLRTSSEKVGAVVLTGQMHGVLPVDGEYSPIGRLLTLRDARATEEAEWLQKSVGAVQLYKITGGIVDASSPICKMLWLRRKLPQVYENTKVFMSVKDFIRLQITGKIATDPTEAAGMLLFNIRERVWDQDLIETCGLDHSKLPPIERPEAIGGYVTAKVARVLGISVGTPVFVGAGDDIEFLGAGLVEPGDTLEHIGTTGSILTCCQGADPDLTNGLELYPHVDSRLTLIGGSTSNAGGSLIWLAKLLSEKKDENPPPLLENELTETVLIPPLFLPYLTGERCPIWDPKARGIFFGLNLSHRKDDLVRSVYEGIAFSLKHIMETIQNNGVPIKSVRVADARAASQNWMELRANIYGKPIVTLENEDATSLGAMLVAAVGLGHYDDYEMAVTKTVHTGKIVSPAKKEIKKKYERRFDLYQQLYERNKDLFSESWINTADS
jgi:xylulokinase